LNFFRKDKVSADEPKKIDLITPSPAKESFDHSISKKDGGCDKPVAVPAVVDLKDEYVERLISNPDTECSPIVSTKLEDTESTPVVASVVVDLMEDESLKSPSEVVEQFSQAIAVNEENSQPKEALDSARPARKRKSCNFFDPTPPTRPRKNKSPTKVDAITTDTTEDVLEGSESTPITPMDVESLEKVDALTEVEQELEKEDANQVDEVLDEEFTEADAATNGKKKKGSTKGGAKKASAKKEKEEPPVKVAPVIPPEQQARIDKKMEHITQLINELAFYEK
jgi:hypothetical protein